MQPLRPHLKTTRQKLSQEDPWVIQMHMKLGLDQFPHSWNRSLLSAYSELQRVVNRADKLLWSWGLYRAKDQTEAQRRATYSRMQSQ